MDRPARRIADDPTRALLAEGFRLIEALREGAALTDQGGLRAAASRLRALAVAVGAAWLANLCLELELQVRFGELGEVSDQIRRIEAEHAGVRYALRTDRPEPAVVVPV